MFNTILRLAFTALIFGFLLYKTDVSNLLSAASHISTGIIIYLLLLTILLLWLSVIKLGIIVESFGKKIPTLKLLKFYLISYFVNTFLPSSVGGDLHRTLKLGNLIGRESAFATTIIERASGLFTMLTVSFLFIWHPRIPVPIRWLISALLLLFMAGMVLIQSVFFVSLIGKIPFLSKYKSKADNIRVALKAGFGKKTLLAKVIFFSYLFHAGAIVNTQASAFAVGWWDASLRELVTVVPIILVIGGIPLTPGNLGITEGAFFFFLKLIGATDAQALGTALILRAKSLLLGIAGGIIWVMSKSEMSQFGRNKRKNEYRNEPSAIAESKVNELL